MRAVNQLSGLVTLRYTYFLRHYYIFTLFVVIIRNYENDISDIIAQYFYNESCMSSMNHLALLCLMSVLAFLFFILMIIWKSPLLVVCV